ncbi:hypothetical protein MMC09_006956 [Bachmanniomyces sp. S44760]|nr:hypothetical protein [Bachmanniomyces sp. S44760]
MSEAEETYYGYIRDYLRTDREEDVPEWRYFDATSTPTKPYRLHERANPAVEVFVYTDRGETARPKRIEIADELDRIKQHDSEWNIKHTKYDRQGKKYYIKMKHNLPIVYHDSDSDY